MKRYHFLFALTIIFLLLFSGFGSILQPVLAQGEEPTQTVEVSPSPDPSPAETQAGPGETTLPATASSTALAESETPSPVFSATATFTPTIDLSTLTSTITPTATFTPLPPIINFICTDLGQGNIRCEDHSTGTIDGRAWFINGTVVLDETQIEYKFTEQGSYPIELTIWGAGKWITERITVNVVFPLMANFSVSATGSELPVEVIFTDTSIGEVTSFHWDFGDGATSTIQHPSHSYTSEGVFSVKLTISGPAGVRLITQTVVIGDLTAESLLPSFTASQAICNAPCAITFIDTSGGPVLSRMWDFGDSTTSTEISVTHTYTQPGTYEPVLSISDGVNTASLTGQIIVNPAVTAPKASFAASITSCQAPCTVQFDESSTGNITSWLWAFGTGADSAQRNPSYTFLEEGVYPVVLTVNGPLGVDQAVVKIYVSRMPSEVTAAFLPMYGMYPNPLAVQFDSTLSTGPIVSYLWNFGDGQTSTAKVPSHIYENEGTYQVTLRVTDGDGNFSETIQPVSVVVFRLPDAEFTADHWSCQAPCTIRFTDQSVPGDAQIVSRYYLSGQNDEFSTEINPVFTYSLPGEYTVSQTVQDANGLSATELHTVNITAQKIHAEFSYSPGLIVFAGDEIDFWDESWGKTSVNWDWDFGDGAFSTLQNPSHVFSVPGTYTMSFTVWAEDGDMDTKTRTITVLAEDDVRAIFSLSPSKSLAPLQSVITNSSLGDIVTYEWLICDGSTSSLPTPLMPELLAPGPCPVTLTVTGVSGKTHTATQYATVLERSEIRIAASPSIGVAPLRTSLSAFITKGSAYNFAWDMGDGMKRYGQAVEHMYLNPGEYIVTVSADSPAGKVTATQTIKVVAAGSVRAALRASVYGGAAPLNVCFTNLSTGEITNTTWVFGDGTTSTEKNPCHTYAAPGDFSAVMTVSGPGGMSQATTTIRAFDSDVQLTSISFAPQGNFAVCFSSAASGGVNMTWLFGDGATSNLDSPCHQFKGPGTFKVILIVQPPNGQPLIGFTEVTLVGSGTIPTSTPTLTPSITPTATKTPTITRTLTSTRTLAPGEPTYTPANTATRTPTAANPLLTPDASLPADISPTPTFDGTGGWIIPPSLQVQGPGSACQMTLYGQDAPNSCLSASVCSLLSVSVDVESIPGGCVQDITNTLTELGVMDESGAPLEAMPEILRAYGRTDAQVEYGLEISDLIERLDAGYQVVLPLGMVGANVNHSVVLLSISGDEVTYGDPLLGEVVTISTALLSERWAGTALTVPAADLCQEPIPPVSPNLGLMALLGAGGILMLLNIAAGVNGPTTTVAGGIAGQLVSNTVCVWLVNKPSGLSAPGGATIQCYPRWTNFTAYAKCTRSTYTWMQVRMSDGKTGWMASNWSNVNLSLLPENCAGVPMDTPPVDDPGSGGGGSSGGGGAVGSGNSNIDYNNPNPNPTAGIPMVTAPNVPLYGTIPLPAMMEACPELKLAVGAANLAIGAANLASTAYSNARYAADRARAETSQAENLRNQNAALAWQLGQQIPSALGEAAKLSVDQGLAWTKLAALKVAQAAAKLVEDGAYWAYDKLRNVPWWLGWTRDAAWSVYDNARKAREELDRQVQNQQRWYDQISAKAGSARSRAADLTVGAAKAAAQAAYWTGVAVVRRGKAILLDGAAWLAKQAKDATGWAKDQAMNLVYRQRGACDALLAERARLNPLAEQLAALTGISAEQWLNASAGDLGRFDKATNMQKLVEWFTGLKDLGVATGARNVVAGMILNKLLPYDESLAWGWLKIEQIINLGRQAATAIAANPKVIWDTIVDVLWNGGILGKSDNAAQFAGNVALSLSPVGFLTDLRDLIIDPSPLVKILSGIGLITEIPKILGWLAAIGLPITAPATIALGTALDGAPAILKNIVKLAISQGAVWVKVIGNSLDAIKGLLKFVFEGFSGLMALGITKVVDKLGELLNKLQAEQITKLMTSGLLSVIWKYEDVWERVLKDGPEAIELFNKYGSDFLSKYSDDAIRLLDKYGAKKVFEAFAVESNWYKSNSATNIDSILYHFDKHVLKSPAGSATVSTIAEYSEYATNFWAKNSGSAIAEILLDGTPGYRIKGHPGGLYDMYGKVVTFWFD